MCRRVMAMTCGCKQRRVELRTSLTSSGISPSHVPSNGGTSVPLTTTGPTQHYYKKSSREYITQLLPFTELSWKFHILESALLININFPNVLLMRVHYICTCLSPHAELRVVRHVVSQCTLDVPRPPLSPPLHIDYSRSLDWDMEWWVYSHCPPLCVYMWLSCRGSYTGE